MATKLITLRPHQGVHQAIDVLIRHNISGAPVVHRNGKLIGVLSEKDCLTVLANIALYRLPGGTVSDYMTHHPVTVGPRVDLLGLAGLFLAHPFRRLPVVDGDGQLVGQVSRRDVLCGIQRMTASPAAYPDYRRPGGGVIRVDLEPPVHR